VNHGLPATLLVAGGLVPSDGGIQAYSRIVWDTLDPVAGRSLISLGAVPSGDGFATSGVIATSKWALLKGVVFRKWPSELCLVTHVGLIKLLPFLRSRPRHVVAFLNGVEVWQRLDWMTRRALRRVDLFLSISQYTWERFVAANPEFSSVRHEVLYLGMGDVAESVPAAENPPAALILGRMSRTEDYKGHRQLIAAWPRVCERVPGARLWVAGTGDLQPDLEALARQAGVDNLVTFFGRVSEEQKQKLLASSRCLVMPSRGEGFGLVYLEAMRLGRPCLVGNQDAGREVVNPPEAGLAVDPDDAAALTDAVTQLLTPGSWWDEWSRAARRRYESNFTAGHFQRRLLERLQSFAAPSEN
jgi:phosphatidylinositol alpha-1,6-mannosyltransferase